MSGEVVVTAAGVVEGPEVEDFGVQAGTVLVTAANSSLKNLNVTVSNKRRR